MDVEKGLNEIFVEERIAKEGEITSETTLSSFRMDSLSAVELLSQIDDKFSIDFPAEELESLVTVGDLINKIKQLIEENK